MDKYLTKDKVSVIIQNAPANTKPEDIVNGLVSRGYTLEGFNDQPKAPESRATFKATGDEGIIGGTAKAIGNIPSSGLNLAESVVTAVAHPIDTAKAIKSVVAGAGAKIGETLFENTDVGQSILKKMNDNRIAQGMDPLKQDANGKLQGVDTPDLQAFNQLGDYFSQRYGSIDGVKKAAIEDPVGVLADVASVFSGGGAALRGTTLASKASEIASKVEPINAISTGTEKVVNAVKDTTVGKSLSEAIPSVNNIKQNEIVKSLDLTQGDLANISKLTGNDVTDFIVKNNLVKDTPEAIADALNTKRVDTMKLVRDEIAKVTDTYKLKDLTDVQSGLKTILEGVDGIAGLENTTKEISTLLKKKNLNLSDVQRAKELIDQNSNIYSKIGDVKSSSTARGLDNIRSNIRKFIEDKVDAATNGATDIRQLNNDVSTSYAIEDAINTRATRNLTRQKISLGDMGVLLGGGAAFSPLVGLGLYMGKKIIETPSFRLGFVKVLSKQPIQKVKTLINEVKSKSVSPETQKFLNDIVDETKRNLPLIESGSNALEATKSQEEQTNQP